MIHIKALSLFSIPFQKEKSELQYENLKNIYHGGVKNPDMLT
jgi:hypothetical protein